MHFGLIGVYNKKINLNKKEFVVEVYELIISILLG